MHLREAGGRAQDASLDGVGQVRLWAEDAGRMQRACPAAGAQQQVRQQREEELWVYHRIRNLPQVQQHMLLCPVISALQAPSDMHGPDSFMHA